MAKSIYFSKTMSAQSQITLVMAYSLLLLNSETMTHRGKCNFTLIRDRYSSLVTRRHLQRCGEQAAELESLLWSPCQFILHHGKMLRFKHSTITKGYCVLKKIERALEHMGCQLKGLTADRYVSFIIAMLVLIFSIVLFYHSLGIVIVLDPVSIAILPILVDIRSD